MLLEVENLVFEENKKHFEYVCPWPRHNMLTVDTKAGSLNDKLRSNDLEIKLWGSIVLITIPYSETMCGLIITLSDPPPALDIFNLKFNCKLLRKFIFN